MKIPITILQIIAFAIGLLTISGKAYTQTKYPITIGLDGTSFLPNVSDADENPP